MGSVRKLSWLLRPLGFLVQAVLGIGIASTCSLLIISQTSSPKKPESIPSTPAAPQASSLQMGIDQAIFGMPARLKISKLGVDADVEELGITSSGNMQAPVGVKNVGWYKQGPQPGNTGSAVIAGHFGRESYGGRSVFDDLHTLGKGDEILVQDEAGQVATFTVREFRIFAKDEIAPEVFTSSDGKAHLNLITC